MTPAAAPSEPIRIPDPDAIRAAIDVTDERARLLRRLLRLALRLQFHLTTAGQLVTPTARKGGRVDG